MLIAIHSSRSSGSNRSDHRHLGWPKTIMNGSLSNGLLIFLIAAIVLLAGLSGTGTTLFGSPNNSYERSAFSAPSVTSAQAVRGSTAPAQASFSLDTNETPRWRSNIMDSYESVPSLAALAKEGKKDARPVPAVAERHPEASSGVSP